MLTLKNISLSFGGLKVLKNINLTTEKGKITGVIGPNGAGKTSLYNVISGLYIPDDGEIDLEGVSLRGKQLHDINLEGVARTFQNVMIFPDLSLLENVLIGRQARTKANIIQSAFKLKGERVERKKAQEKALELLNIVGLEDKAHELARNLPYGEQRNLDIARALATDPKLLLLDEPAAGLNLTEREVLKQLVLDLNKQGYTIMIIEHDMKLIMDMCDYIFVLNYGEKISEGEPEYVQNDELVLEAYLGKRGAEDAKS